LVSPKQPAPPVRFYCSPSQIYQDSSSLLVKRAPRKRVTGLGRGQANDDGLSPDRATRASRNNDALLHAAYLRRYLQGSSVAGEIEF
ncbi:hypothetical protein BaRGS_00015200, partial [Batillaria attramentaria]